MTKALLEGAPRADGYVEKLTLDDVERCLQFRDWKKATLAGWLLRAYLPPGTRSGCLNRDQCDSVLYQACTATMRDGSGPAFP